MTKLWIAAVAATAAALSACGQQAAPGAKPDTAAPGAQPDTAAAASAVERVEQEMLAAFQAKDAARLGAHYAPDAVVALPGRSARGKAAIDKINAEDLADPNFKLTFANEKTEVAASADLAYTIGSFNVSYTDSKTKQPATGAGSYMTVFKKQADGNWKVAADFATPGG